jgi:hypothetical protein
MIFDRDLNAQASATRTGRRHPAIVDEAGRCVGVLSDLAVAAALAHDPKRSPAILSRSAGPDARHRPSPAPSSGRCRLGP